VVWSSLAQEGFQQGGYGRAVSLSGEALGDEFRVNTLTSGPQLHPTVAADGVDRFLVCWSGFVGGLASFDLFGQRYASESPLLPPPAPFVSALSPSRLLVTWPELAGYPVAGYELYVDGASAALSVAGIVKEIGALAAGSTHAVRLAYRLADGRISTLSEAVQGTTWGDDQNLDGLPDDWQARYWGGKAWPGASVDSDGDGATNAQEFLAGTNPLDASSVLTTHLETGAQGARLRWNTQPGNVYQVQESADLQSWANLGSARFAASGEDSIAVPTGTVAGYYRVVRVR